MYEVLRYPGSSPDEGNLFFCFCWHPHRHPVIFAAHADPLCCFGVSSNPGANRLSLVGRPLPNGRTEIRRRRGGLVTHSRVTEAVSERELDLKRAVGVVGEGCSGPEPLRFVFLVTFCYGCDIFRLLFSGLFSLSAFVPPSVLPALLIWTVMPGV